MKKVLKLLLCISVIVMGAAVNAHADNNICDSWYEPGACNGAQSTHDIGSYYDPSTVSGFRTDTYREYYRDMNNNLVYDCYRYKIPTACIPGYRLSSDTEPQCASENGGTINIPTPQCVEIPGGGGEIGPGGNTCDTMTCLRNSDCRAGWYTTCTDGCCTGMLTCTYGNCQSNSDCASGNCSNYCCTNPSQGDTTCSDGQYWNGSSCANCTNKPSNSSYTGSGTTATDCPWECDSGYTLDENNNTCVAGSPSCAHGTCSSSSDCTSGTWNTCSGGCCVTGGSACSMCSSDNNCPGNQTCNTTTGCCQAGSGGGTGTSCSTDADCSGTPNTPLCRNGVCSAVTFPVCSSTACTTDNDCDIYSSGGGYANNPNFSGVKLQGPCINGYCYTGGSGQFGQPQSLAYCSQKCTYGTCVQRGTGTLSYYCVPNCSTGEYFNNAPETCGCATCVAASGVYTDPGLTTLVTPVADSSGYGPITSCHILKDTSYYDAAGSFHYASDCNYSAD